MKQICFGILFSCRFNVCVIWGGGGSITEEVGVQGEKSIHLRVTQEQRAQLFLRGRGTLGNRENMGNKGTGTIFPPWEGLIGSL